MDTRPAPNTVGSKSTPIGEGLVHTVGAHGTNGQCTDIPSTAKAVSLNVTALHATAGTFLTIWAAGATRPGASSLNPQPGAPPTPNAVTTELSGSGEFSIFNNKGSVNVFVDINGYYVDHDHDGRYYTEDEVDSAIAAVDAAPASHLHDDRYYTEDEVDSAIAAVGTPVVSTTSKVGGNGGGAYDLPCPAGAVAIGLRGRVAGFQTPGINVVKVVCQVVTPGRLAPTLGATTETNFTGAENASATFNFTCPSGSVMTGVSGGYRGIFGGPILTDVAVKCAGLGNGAVTLLGPVHSNGGDTPFSLDCAPGSHVVGIGPAKADQLLDSLRLKCST